MATYTPFEQEILTLVTSLDQKVSGLDQKVSGLDQKVSGLDQKVSGLEWEMRSGFDNLDQKINRITDDLADFRDESRAESANNRTLLHQAFTHIADQLSREGDMDFVPKYPRIKK